MPRLHKSSWVLAALTLMVCVLIVVPGQIADSHLAPYPNYLHGWPLCFLYRDVDDVPEAYVDGTLMKMSASWAIVQPPSSPPWMSRDSWRLWHAQETTWKPFNLLLDLVAAVAVVVLMTAAWEYRRRRRSNAFQVRLIEFFVVTTVVACVLAWMSGHADSYREEMKAIKAAGQEYSVGFGVPYERCVAPVWLQRLIGPGSFPQYFYRVHELMLDLDQQSERDIDKLINCLGRLEYLKSVDLLWYPNHISKEVERKIHEQLPHIEVDPEE